MTERCVLLVGTPKGAFVLDGDAGRRDWTASRPAVRGLADPRRLRRARHRRAARRGRQPVVRAGGLAQRRPRRDVDPLQRGPHLRRRRPEGRDGLERHRDPTTRSTRASSRPACSAAATAARTWEHVEGLTNHPTPPGVGARRRRPDPALDRPPPDGPGPRVGRHLGGRRVRDAATAARRGRRATRASGRASSPDIYPEFGQCVHKLVMAADGGEHLYQQNHCGVYRSANGGEQWEEITPGLPSEFGFPMTRPPARPEDRLDDPAERVRPGPVHARCVAPRVWRTHDGGDTWIRSGDGLPQQDAYLRRAARGDGRRRLDPVGRLLRDEHRASCTAARTRAARGRCVADNLPPIWSVEAAVVG